MIYRSVEGIFVCVGVVSLIRKLVSETSLRLCHYGVVTWIFTSSAEIDYILFPTCDGNHSHTGELFEHRTSWAHKTFLHFVANSRYERALRDVLHG
jgi:hypothetical protein